MRFSTAHAFLTTSLLFSGCARQESNAPKSADMPLPAPAEALPPTPHPLSLLRFPTAQDKLTDASAPGVFQDTGNGNQESGHFGSVRTGANGLPRFHEGIDIAAIQRDQRGRPRDSVHAAADGTVGLVNRVAGNSAYGKYIVLMHDDPVGPVYTLYGHLMEIEAGMTDGKSVRAGEQIGIMGNTALEPIPMQRAHLHFEIGLLANAQFLSWPGRKQRNTPGGLYNGQNLLGLNPINVFSDRLANASSFSLLSHIQNQPAAFDLLVRPRRQLVYFESHPALWSGDAYTGAGMVLSLSEGGFILKGRNATPEECAAAGRVSSKALNINTNVLGRNGRRYIVQSNGVWKLGQNGQTWVDILTHPGGTIPF